MSSLSNDNFKNENFRFSTAKFISIGDTKIWTQRLSYVESLYELYVEIKDAKKFTN